MPTDYTRQIESAFDSISKKGTAIRIYGAEVQPDTNPEMPWLGSGIDAPFKAHFALFTQVQTRADLVVREGLIIPAKGLDGLDTEALIQIVDKDGNPRQEFYRLHVVTPLRPDANQPILYKCEFEAWPGNK